jgi:hypothetical protein
VPRPAVDEYPERKRSWSAEQERLSRQDARIAYTRLALFGAAALIGVLALRGLITGWWLLLPLAVFVGLLKHHDRIIHALAAATRLIAFYERGIGRLEDRWAGSGEPGDRFLDDTHLYAADLDLFGRGSLFELLSLARTQAGEATLASWLKQPAVPHVIRLRHGAVEELRLRLDLRESLTLAGGDIRQGVHPEYLVTWATALPEAGISHRLGLVVALTVLFPALLAVAWVSGSIVPVVAAIAVRALYEQLEGRHLEPVLQRAGSAARELEVLRPALRLIERESFTSAALTDLQAHFRETKIDASAAIRRLARLAEMHDWTHNLIFKPIAAMLMWDTHLAYATERWRAAHGRHVSDWLRSVGEFEALSSLAAYSYEHPDDPLPDVTDQVPARAAALFVGEALGHPLLPAAQMVRNDIQLGVDAQLLVVSGSNMSGKSTMLRTVGINAVLALAGGPVRARALRISPLALGATLRIQDSLQQGRSRFFAEISRIRQIADVAATQPLLFLLDELFHGTNSHDRLVGATGVLRTLIDRGAIGLITTHDLALTAITRDLGGRAVNVHFEDTFDGAEMRFDYRMKDGPVTRSNAIALMRAVGLDVREDVQ